MRVAYFPNSCALNSGPVMQAMLDSLRRAGHRIEENSVDADCAIIWSVLWYGRMANNKAMYEHYRAQNKPVIVVDVGALHRGQTWKIALNHINRLGYYGHTEDLDQDRPAKLGISLGINTSTNPAILITGQHRFSLQLANQVHEEWIMDQINEIRKVTDRSIIVRPHPRSPIEVGRIGRAITVEKPQKIAGTYDDFNLHFNYHAVVNYSSGPGIQAAIAGTRPIVGTYSLALPVSVAIEDIEKPYDIDRHQWLVELCHTEYTIDEIKEGTWIRRLKL